MTRPVSLSAQSVMRLLAETRPWLSCEDCFERVDFYAEGQANGHAYRDQPLETHLRGCAACAEEADSLIDLLRSQP